MRSGGDLFCFFFFKSTYITGFFKGPDMACTGSWNVFTLGGKCFFTHLMCMSLRRRGFKWLLW